MKNEAPGTTVNRAEFLNLFAAVFLPMFLAAVDQTLLATATPAIADSLGGLRDTSWIAVAYLLTTATIVPVYGRFGDLKGRRNVLLVALGVFALGSLACGLAQTMPQLLAARVLQGLGGGGLMTLSQALIGELVPPRERIRFQGYFAIIFTSASVSGPVIGGLVVSHTSWRVLFLINLPLIAFAAWRLWRLPPGDRHVPEVRGRDVPGHVLFAIGAVSALFWLTSVGHRFVWNSVESIGIFVLALTTIALLVRHELRHPAPFLPVELLRERVIALSALLTALFASCLFAIVFFLPIYLQLGHNISVLASGFLLLPVTAGMVTAAMLASRLLGKTGDAHWIPVGGMAIAAAALLLLAVVPPGVTLIIALGFVTGIGLGAVMPINQVVVQTVSGRHRLGAAMSLVSLARATGGAAGAALFGAVVFAIIPDVDRQALANTADVARVVHAFHWGFLCAAVVAGLAAFTASRIPRVKLWAS
jgi:EmrB/QacA subfamily drug resistance transporter